MFCIEPSEKKRVTGGVRVVDAWSVCYEYVYAEVHTYLFRNFSYLQQIKGS